MRGRKACAAGGHVSTCAAMPARLRAAGCRLRARRTTAAAPTERERGEQKTENGQTPHVRTGPFFLPFACQAVKRNAELAGGLLTPGPPTSFTLGAITAGGLNSGAERRK